MFEPRSFNLDDIHEQAVVEHLGNAEAVVLSAFAFKRGKMDEHCFLLAVPTDEGADLVLAWVHWPHERKYSCVRIHEIAPIDTVTRKRLPSEHLRAFTLHQGHEKAVYDAVGGAEFNPGSLWQGGIGLDHAALVRTFDPKATEGARRLFMINASTASHSEPWEVEILASADIDELRDWASAEFQTAFKP